MMLLLVDFALADQGAIYLHKVGLVLKDGSKIRGYIFWGENWEKNSSYSPTKYLDEWAKNPKGNNQFKFVKAVYPINDNGISRGIAHLKEDLIKIDASLVVSIVSMPDKYEGWEITCGFPELSREQISMMQNPLISTDSIADELSDTTAFCYDPKMKKSKLHLLLEQFIRAKSFILSPIEFEKWEREKIPPNIVILSTGCP